jgi:hypothetical protein
MAVYVGVPVEAAVECGIEYMRRKRIGVAVHRVADVVGIFRVQALESETGKSRRRRGIDRNRSFARSGVRRGARRTD